MQLQVIDPVINLRNCTGGDDKEKTGSFDSDEQRNESKPPTIRPNLSNITQPPNPPCSQKTAFENC